MCQVIDNAGGQTLGYTYNGQNDLVFRSRSLNNVAQPAVSYLNDPTGDLSQLLAEFPASGPSTYYVPGIGNSPLGQDVVGGVQTWFARDGLGSVRALFNSSAAQVRLTNLDPYGSPLESSGSVSTHLGYTGALTDETGLVYLHARFYAPGSGQFLSADPLEGRAVDPRSWNRYGYVSGNPGNLTDPGGKCFSLQLTNDQCGFGSWQHIIGHPGAGGALGMAIAAAVTNIGQAVQNAVSSAWSSVSNAVSQAASGVSDTWTATWNGVNQALQGFVFFANSSNGSAQPQGPGNSSSNSPQPEPVPEPPNPNLDPFKIPDWVKTQRNFSSWLQGFESAYKRSQTVLSPSGINNLIGEALKRGYTIRFDPPQGAWGI